MRRSRARGFTITELTVASAVAITLGTVLLQMYQATLDGLGAITAQGIMRMELAKALNAISKDAQEAVSRGTGACEGQLATPATGRVILLLPRLNADGNPSGLGNDDWLCYEFRSDPGELWRHVIPQGGSSRPADDRVVARAITSFTYTAPFPSGKQFQCSIRARRTERGRTYHEPPSGNLQVEFSLRNWANAN